MNDMKKIWTVAWLPFCLSCIIFLVQAEEVYKWLDSEGETYYSDILPAEVEEWERVKVTPGLDAPEGTVEELTKKADTLRNERFKQEEVAKSDKEDAEQQHAICEQARKRLSSYQRPRVNVVNEDNSRRRVTEEERQAELKRANLFLKENCS